MESDWGGLTASYGADLDSLLKGYRDHRSARDFVIAVATLVGPDLTPGFLRNLDAFLLDDHRILTAVDENGQPDISLVLLTTPYQAEIVVLHTDPNQPSSNEIRSTQDLRRLLSTSSTQTQTDLFSALTGRWPSCIMELLHFEITRTSPPPDPEYKRQCTRHLLALSKKHGVLPPSFFLHDVVRAGDRAVSGGSYSDVWQGRLHGKPVCLKVVRLFTTVANRARVIKQFCREALVWKHLDHPNVLPLLGVNMELFKPSFCLVSPWMQNGNLLDYLEKNPTHNRLKALLEVAEGMDYLHRYDPPIVHADIRCGNILVTDKLVCCLADFGLARVAESQPATTTSFSAGTVRWMAPELLIPTADDESQTQNHSSRDIYAFGCTVLEVYTLKPPFHYYRYDPAVSRAVTDGLRPPRPEQITSDRLWDIVEQCWNSDPLHRPSSQHLVSLFEQLMESDQDQAEKAACFSNTASAPIAIAGSSKVFKHRCKDQHDQPPDDAANEFIPSSFKTSISESSTETSQSSESVFGNGSVTSEHSPSVSSSPTSSVLSKSSDMDPGKSKTELWKIHSLLIFKPDIWVNLDLLNQQRLLIHSGKLLRLAVSGHAWNRWSDFYALLFDNYLLLTEPREKEGALQYYVDSQPIPLELITIERSTPLVLHAQTRNDQMSRQRQTSYPITLNRLGCNTSPLILYAETAQASEEWETKLQEAIESRKGRKKLFTLESFFARTRPVTSQTFWTPLGTPTCFASFAQYGLLAIGYTDGVWIGSRHDAKLRRVLRLSAVTQCAVLETFGIFLVLADRTLYAYDMESLTTSTPHTITSASQLPRKLNANQDVEFFDIGQLHGKTLLIIYMRRKGLDNIFRVLEPVNDKKLTTTGSTRLFRPVRTEWFRPYREFCFPSDSFGVTILTSKIAILSTAGFEIVDLTNGESVTIPASSDARRANILKRCKAHRPLGMCRAGSEGFLLVFDEFGLYVNRQGEPRQSNCLCEWAGTAKQVAFCDGYAMLVNTNFIEVRHVETSRLVQVIRGTNICSLYNNDGKVGIAMDVAVHEGDLLCRVFEILFSAS